MRQFSPELRVTLAPLVVRARRLPCADRAAWLDHLRTRAPVLTAALEEFLTTDSVSAPDPQRAAP